MKVKILIILASIIAVFFIVSFSVGFLISAPTYSGAKSDHFNGKKFINPTGKEARGFGEVFKWMLNREREPWKEENNPQMGAPPDPKSEELKITFVNHSTFLIQYKNINILTDPVWSERTSPFQWAGPKRMRPPGIRFEDLPKIDLILISHNHYDHLDENTMKKLNDRFQPKVISPLGVSKFIQKLGYDAAEDLDWWEKSDFKDLNITCVPAQHFSGRGMFDRDGTLWAGYVISDADKKIYFAGDTGYDDAMFKEIGAKFDSMDVSLIPIGAYKPKWFMSPIHVSPEEALLIHRDVKSKKSIGMHFGTFPLADDGQKEPLEDLKIAMSEQGIDVKDFFIVREGEYAYF